MEGLLERRQRSRRVPGVMSENLPLTLFIVFSVAIYLINAFYLLRWARMPGTLMPGDVGTCYLSLR